MDSSLAPQIMQPRSSVNPRRNLPVFIMIFSYRTNQRNIRQHCDSFILYRVFHSSFFG
uniref:Uncharacterized protein n=1 Tax=Manihot esculenta TaxID=3983 RepID=A0A2C9VXC5_MANES